MAKLYPYSFSPAGLVPAVVVAEGSESRVRGEVMHKAIAIVAVLIGFVVGHTERFIAQNKKFLTNVVVTLAVSEAITIVLVHMHA
jgi:hypothetical protein